MDKIALTNHVRDHNPKNKTCDVCGKSFTNKYSLNVHMKSSHGDPNQLEEKKVRMRTIQCETCNRQGLSSNISLYSSKLKRKKKSRLALA